ncbi:hypothetical protein LTR37_015484 [Vermiconidia calcicola]|uniref:Uncharacterized protein n=1 Tax=Vermiconidia calcicola TaxID=1690605 RepID=A0ACC3MQH3_9PEZI|nr:hypothetical protein LTR37_015484 [Vermiconidia calcicola]
MSTTDLPLPAPRSVSKLRRKLGKNNDSSNSLAESSNDDDPNADASRRSSTSGGLGKLKDRMRRKSVDERRRSDDSGKRLSAIIPDRKSRRLEKEKSSEFERNGSTDSGTGPAHPTFMLPTSRSDSSLNLAGSGRSSLLTDDNSEHEGKPVRPTLSTHNSHAGYLTLSSPEFNPQTTSDLTESAKHSPKTLPFAASTTSIPQIIEPSHTEPLLHSLAPKRNSSPVERFTGAFTLPKKTPAKDASTVKSGGSGQTAFGGLFKPSSRRNSVATEKAVDAVQAQDSTQVGTEEGQAPLEKTGIQPDKSKERPQTPQRTGRPRVNTGSLPATPPNLTDTPTTFVTPPTPTDPSAEFPRQAIGKAPPARKRTDTLSSVDSIKNRRAQSGNTPSKLSQSIPPPLPPTAEETKTPGGTLSHPSAGSSFFSSFLSTAQKTANQFSNSIAIGGNQKSKAATIQAIEDQGGEEVIPGSDRQPELTSEDVGKKGLAVETLWTGDLNFAHLGLTDEPSAMPSATDQPMQNGVPANEAANKKAEEQAAARAVSEAYEKPLVTAVSEAQGTGRSRPLSVASNDRLTLTGDQTPPRTGGDVETIKRSGSVRSRLSGRRRRHRNSSATAGTVNSIAAGLAATGTGLGNVATSGSGHRLTGFAVASSKRNKDFHQLFRSVPEDDYLIEDYSAALQRDILLHGRLYVSEGHICFSSNILGWVTNLVISFDEVVSVEKKSTAVIFPNAIVIQTLQARNTFASFVARDSTYELLIGIWKISHPNLKSSLNGVTLDDAGTGDKTEVAEPEGSDASSRSGSEDEVYDEDADDDAGSFDDGGIASSMGGSEIGDHHHAISRKTSAAPLAAGAPQTKPLTNGHAPKGLEFADAIVTGAAVSADFPGAPTHEPTQCTESGEHYDRPLTDTTIPAPLGKIYSMMFGPASGAFMSKWLVEEQKSRELNMVDDKIGLDNDHKQMVFDYIKPLSGSIGPKQTKCITTNRLVAFDLEKAVSIDCSTQTPDVPSGNVFLTKTRYCMMWGPGNSTRLIATCTIEWSGKSWLKGPIEKGANDGQIAYVNAIVAALTAAVTTKPPVKGMARKGKRKGKKEVFDAGEANAQRAASIAVDNKVSNWGIFEPLHDILKPVISLLSPFITSQVIIAVLMALLLYTWISPPARRGGMGVGYPGYTSPERLAAYEELWRREESNLWDWLEDRVGLDGIYVPSGERQKVLAAKNMGKKVEEERMSERQVDDAIRVTEERLGALKGAVGRRKVKGAR